MGTKQKERLRKGIGRIVILYSHKSTRDLHTLEIMEGQIMDEKLHGFGRIIFTSKESSYSLIGYFREGNVVREINSFEQKKDKFKIEEEFV